VDLERAQTVLQDAIQWPVRIQDGALVIAFDVRKQHKIDLLLNDEDSYKIKTNFLRTFDLKEIPISFIVTEGSTISQYNTLDGVLHSPSDDRPSKVIFDHSTSKFTKHWHLHGVYFRANGRPNYIIGDGLEVKLEEEGTPDESVVETIKKVEYLWITRHYRQNIQAPVKIVVTDQTKITHPVTRQIKFSETGSYRATWSNTRSTSLCVDSVSATNMSEIYEDGKLKNRTADEFSVEWYINQDERPVSRNIDDLLRTRYLTELNLWEAFPVMGADIELICSSMLKNEVGS
jgi:hypothetical protein